MQVGPLADRAHHGSAGVDAAGLGHGLEPRRDIDPVAEHVALLLDHVAEIEPDPQLQRPPGEPVLDRHRRVQRLAGAAEHREEPVARGLEHPAAMPLDRGHHHLVDARPQAVVGAGLVVGHQPAVADHVPGHDGRQSARHRVVPIPVSHT